jgi:hypothetical protein
MKGPGAYTRARRKGELASFEDLRRLDERPVVTGRCRVLGPVFAGAVSAPFAALQFQVELASQPEQQGTTSNAGSSTTATRALQTAPSPARNPRQGVGRV